MAHSKRKIKVRKNTNPEYVRNLDDEYHTPLAAQDSKWSGISFKSNESNNIEHSHGTNEDECEIKLIDLESSSTTSPLLLLFPDLRNEGSLEHSPIVSQKSTSSLTRLLKGKTPKMELLLPSKKLKPVATLEPLQEISDPNSDESVCRPVKHEKACMKLNTLNDSHEYFADGSDDEQLPSSSKKNTSIRKKE